MDKTGNQVGYLILKDDGAVLESGGELKNDERTANIIIDLLQLTESVDESFMAPSSCERISITYESHCYNICMSNRRIYITKLRFGGTGSGGSGAGGGGGGSGGSAGGSALNGGSGNVYASDASSSSNVVIT